MQAVNALLILLYIPLFNGFPLGGGRAFPGIYGGVAACGVRVTPLRKMSVGFFLTVLAFSVSALAQSWIDAERPPPGSANAPAPPAPPPSVNIGWQLLAYVILTAAEILVSITSLEFSYTQAPPAMKSWVMATYLSSVSLGNAFTALVNALWPEDATDVQYYDFFTWVMLAAAILFVPVAYFYREKSYLPSAVAPEPGAGARSEAPALATPKQTELGQDEARRF